MRYSLLAGGKRIRPVLALATACAIGRDPERGPAARRRARADPHVLADPRRPAGDRRRRPPPRPAHVPQALRRGRGDPRRRRPLRRGVPARPARAARRSRARPRGRRRAGRRDRRQRDGRRRVHRRARSRRHEGVGLRRLHRLKTGRLIGAAVECVLLLSDASARRGPSFRAFAAELGVLLPDRRRHPRRDRDRCRAGKAARLRRATREAHVRQPVRPARRALDGGGVARQECARRSHGRRATAPRSSSRSPTWSSRAPRDRLANTGRYPVLVTVVQMA